MGSKSSEKSASSKKTLSALRAIHDKHIVVPSRIQTAIAVLAASGDEWIYEEEFRLLVNPPLNHNDIGKYRDQFKEFWAEMPMTHRKNTAKRVWFANKKIATEWKAIPLA